MNLGKRELTDNEFDDHYRIVCREMEKIISKQRCSGTAISENIYPILTSRDSDVEKLYFRLGDFFYYYAKSKRKLITNSPDWFISYCNEFNSYSYFITNMCSICVMLNSILINSGRGRRIREYGYIIWYKCVIQPLQAMTPQRFSSELRNRLLSNDATLMIALESLKLVVLDVEDPFFIYRTLYEDKAVRILESVYKDLLDIDSINNFVNKACLIWDDVTIKMEKCFLQESHTKVKEMIDEITVIENEMFIRDEIKNLISDGFDTFKRVCNDLMNKSDEFRNICIDCIREYTRIAINLKMESLDDDSDMVSFFENMKETLIWLTNIVNKIFEGKEDNLVKEIFEEEAKSGKNEISIKLGNFSDLCIKDRDYENNKKLFMFFIRRCTDYQSFYEVYLKYLTKRLLAYKFSLEKEIDFKNGWVDVLNPQQRSKINDMIGDIYESMEFNNNFYKKLTEKDIKEIFKSQDFIKNTVKTFKVNNFDDSHEDIEFDENIKYGLGKNKINKSRKLVEDEFHDIKKLMNQNKNKIEDFDNYEQYYIDKPTNHTKSESDDCNENDIINNYISMNSDKNSPKKFLYHEINNTYFTSLLKIYAWPFNEEPLYKKLKIPYEMQNYVKKITKMYLDQNKEKKLYWNWDIGTVDIELNTTETYKLRLNMYQYCVLYNIKKNKKIKTEKLSELIGLEYSVTWHIIETFRKIGILKLENLYVYYNLKFKSDKKEWDLSSMMYNKSDAKPYVFDKKIFYKAKVAGVCKINPVIGMDCLVEKVRAEVEKNFKFENDFFKEALGDLCEVDLIEIKENKVLYDV